MTSLICPNCKGNGYNRHVFEAEESIIQCKICDSLGMLDENTHYHQTWDGDTYEGKTARVLYYGPPLDPENFPNYKIHKR